MTPEPKIVDSVLVCPVAVVHSSVTVNQQRSGHTQLSVLHVCSGRAVGRAGRNCREKSSLATASVRIVVYDHQNHSATRRENVPQPIQVTAVAQGLDLSRGALV